MRGTFAHLVPGSFLRSMRGRHVRRNFESGAWVADDALLKIKRIRRGIAHVVGGAPGENPERRGDSAAGDVAPSHGLRIGLVVQTRLGRLGFRCTFLRPIRLEVIPGQMGNMERPRLSGISPPLAVVTPRTVRTPLPRLDSTTVGFQKSS